MNKYRLRFLNVLLIVLANIGFGLLLKSCGAPVKTPEEIRKERSDYVQHDCELVDITFEGETHEYVRYVRGAGDHSVGSLTHWAGCKYCKERERSNENDIWTLF